MITLIIPEMTSNTKTDNDINTKTLLCITQLFHPYPAASINVHTGYGRLEKSVRTL